MGSEGGASPPKASPQKEQHPADAESPADDLAAKAGHPLQQLDAEVSAAVNAAAASWHLMEVHLVCPRHWLDHSALVEMSTQVLAAVSALGHVMDGSALSTARALLDFAKVLLHGIKP